MCLSAVGRIAETDFIDVCREGSMQRIAGFMMLIWLATSAAAQAQTVPQGTSRPGTGLVKSSSATTSPHSAFSAFGTTTGGAAGPATPGSASASATAGISAAPSANPQAAVQLPGEASNASTQGANSTASGAAAGHGASSMPCLPALPSATGTTASAGELFGAASLGGC
jgi:hypothetical protein